MRHHEIIGGQFEPEAARALDKGQILIGQSEDGDARKIDLLPPRQFEQQIDGPS